MVLIWVSKHETEIFSQNNVILWFKSLYAHHSQHVPSLTNKLTPSLSPHHNPSSYCKPSTKTEKFDKRGSGGKIFVFLQSNSKLKLFLLLFYQLCLAPNFSLTAAEHTFQCSFTCLESLGSVLMLRE